MCFRPATVKNVCPECGADNFPGVKECLQCGAALDGGHEPGKESGVNAPSAPTATPKAPGTPPVPGAPKKPQE